MSNTDRLYEAIRDFTVKRNANRDEYFRRKKALEAYKGSDGYAADLEAAMKIRKAADDLARGECRKIVNEVFADMEKQNGIREIEAPTAEQIRILTVVQMMKNPSRGIMEAAANSLGGNMLALSALTSIAKEAWKDNPNKADRVAPNYAERAKGGYNEDAIGSMIEGLRRNCNEILSGSGASRVRETTARMHRTAHGGSFDADDLPREAPYTSKRDFYDRELGLHFGQNGQASAVDYGMFAAAVDGSANA